MDPVLCADGHTYERRAIEAWCDSSCCHHMLLARVVTRPHVTDARRSEGLLGSHAHRSDVVSIQRGSTLVTKQSSSRRACTSCAVSKTQAACGMQQRPVGRLRASELSAHAGSRAATRCPPVTLCARAQPAH